MEPSAERPPDLVPVTVIGGYLGAGKTTLVNRLLAGRHGRRLAVLVNDFGEINIDAALIEAHDGDTVSLTNGCVCCSIQDSLGAALDQVLTMVPPPDQVIVEASGVADPSKVAMYGQGWPGCRLDAVIVLADAETIRDRVEDEFVGRLVAQQLTAADLLVLTKLDLVAPDDRAAVVEWARATTGHQVTVLAASHGDVDPEVVLDLGGPFTSGDSVDASAAGHELFDTRSVRFEAPVARERLVDALDGWSDEVVRVKGVVDLEGEGPHLVQRVGRRWSLEPIGSGVLAQIGGGAAGLLVMIRCAVPTELSPEGE